MMREEVCQETLDWHLNKMETIHDVFKAHVEKHRVVKDSERDRIFNADVVLGTEAKEIGLVDECGYMGSVMEREFAGVKIVNFSKAGWKENLKASFGMSFFGSSALSRAFMA